MPLIVKPEKQCLLAKNQNKHFPFYGCSVSVLFIIYKKSKHRNTVVINEIHLFNYFRKVSIKLYLRRVIKIRMCRETGLILRSKRIFPFPCRRLSRLHIVGKIFKFISRQSKEIAYLASSRSHHQFRNEFSTMVNTLWVSEHNLVYRTNCVFKIVTGVVRPGEFLAIMGTYFFNLFKVLQISNWPIGF